MAQAVSLIRQTQGTYATSWCLEVLAWIAADRGQHRKAATLLGAIAALARAMGSPALWQDLRIHHEQCEQHTRHALGEQEFDEAFTRGQDLPVDEAIAYALDQQPKPKHVPTGSEPPGTAAAGSSGQDSMAGLTRRERQVAALLAEGLSNKEIATRLVISPRTVEGHLDHIMAKLGCTSRTQVATWAAAWATSTHRPS
jgi:non-specific serine/threonine protein kinase